MSAERTHLFTAHRSGLRFALIIGLALSPACKRVALELDNLSCDGGTCVDGYVCNPTTNMCEKEGSNTCVSETEIPCNGVDEDCDGSDLQESGTTTNCSACGDDCTTAFEVAAAICNTTTGTNICEITLCNPGFLDVDRVAETGCEGTCRQSNGGVETCDGVDNDCNGSIDDITGAAADADCNAKITGANVGTWTCMAGRCEVSSCATDFHDVDGFATNGCEYNCTDTGAETCDGIDNDCNKIIDDVADATADCNTRLSNPPDVVELSCTAGVCVITGCAAGTVDTNTTASDGCEGTCTAAGAEACDGTDTDCDGFIDNAPPGSTGCSDFYVDADGDLFGETGSGVCLCRANSTNSAATDGDCDDTSAACTANCDDNDSDSIFDCKDFCVDVDGDGVGDGAFAKLACDTQSSDSNDGDSSACTDDDGDNCDDCSVARWDPFFDGADADSDGICDAGDTCTDVDGDGLGNGTLSNVGCGDSTTDTDDSDPNTCGDTDFDTCEDCLSGTWDPAADGPDDDSDGTCNAGEGLCVDTDGDGLGDGSNGNAGCEHSDTDSTLDNAYLCADTDNDTCDDCSVEGFFNPANDGTDTDADTICDASDVCPGFDDRLDNDGDGIPDGCDPCPGNQAPGADCGVCMTCNGSGACNENLAEDADCGLCEECASGGGCRDQSSGDDVKVECADADFCNGTETCDGSGACQAGSNPCPDTECNNCDEANDSCFDPAGTSCDDGLFCNGVETCDGTGNCDNGGDPCPGTECKNCNETDDNCFDPSGTACTDDGFYCTGPEQCDGSGSCNSTGNSCSGAECNTCNEAADNCIDPYGTACTDDGVACTDDICSAGACNPANEGACGGGEICNACMYSGTGCGALPTSLALSCDTSAVVGNPASCTITLDGFQCEGANIICVPDIVPTTLFSDNGNTDPDANPDWATISGDPTIESGWLVADNVDWTVETIIDTSGMDVVCIEFDWRIINENAGEYILVEFSTNGGSIYQEAVRIDFRPDSEPESWKREELLLAWFGNACLTDIDALAANNTDLRVRLRLVSNAGNDKVYVDNFNVIGFPVTTSTVLLDDPFDDFDNWTTLSGTPQLTIELPSGNSAAVADKELVGPNSWSAFTSVDASSCDVVDLDFDIAFDRADGGETIAVAMSTDGGSGWTNVMSIDFDKLDADNLRRTWNRLMRLTDLDPAAAGKGDLRVSITLSSNSNGREVYLDNLQIICYDLPDPATLFTANSYTDNGDGSYGFTVDATSPGTAELTCTWDNGDDPALADTVTTDFTP